MVALLALLGAGTVFAQPTLNIAPRIHVPIGPTPLRSVTLCNEVPASQSLAFAAWTLVDPDAVADMLVRIDLEPGGAGTSSIVIPNLASRPGVNIIRMDSERIRFTAPLATAAAALSDLIYFASPAPQLDVLDISVDDQQVPPLSAEVRAFIRSTSDIPFPNSVSCKPPPDLLPGSDTGVDDDDITEAGTLEFLASRVFPGAVVTLLDDDVPVATATATGTTMVIADPAPEPGLTHLYSVSINGEIDGSAGWSVAVLNGLFIDGFEDPPPPP